MDDEQEILVLQNDLPEGWESLTCGDCRFFRRLPGNDWCFESPHAIIKGEDSPACGKILLKEVS